MPDIFVRRRAAGRNPDSIDWSQNYDDHRQFQTGEFRALESFGAGAGSISAATDYAGVTAVAATLTLPQASAAKRGHILVIHDESGVVTPASYITINTYSGDTIESIASSIVIKQPRGTVTLTSKGGTNWVWLDLPQAYQITVASTSISATIAAVTDWEKCDSSGGALIMALPLAADVLPGKRLIVSDSGGAAGTNQIAVSPSGADTLRGGNNGTSHLIAAAYTHIEVMSDGVSSWFVTQNGAGTPTL